MEVMTCDATHLNLAGMPLKRFELRSPPELMGPRDLVVRIIDVEHSATTFGAVERARYVIEVLSSRDRGRRFAFDIDFEPMDPVTFDIAVHATARLDDAIDPGGMIRQPFNLEWPLGCVVGVAIDRNGRVADFFAVLSQPGLGSF